MKRVLKPLRVVLALVCFVSVNAAFLMPVVAETLCLESSPDFSWAAKMQFLPSLLALNFAVVVAILAVTALAGRVYCSTVCPFGVLQDVAIRVRRIFMRRSCREMVPTWLLVEFFGVLALCTVASSSLLAVCDPYAHYGRIATNLVRPAVQWLANCGAAWSDAHEKYWLMSVDVAAPAAFALVVSVATLVMVVAFALWRGRWFCNHVCPVGACLRLASRKTPLLKIRIDAAKCVGCGICERGCKAGAIDAKAKTVDNGLCVRCFDCLGACGKGAVGL